MHPDDVLLLYKIIFGALVVAFLAYVLNYIVTRPRKHEFVLGKEPRTVLSILYLRKDIFCSLETIHSNWADTPPAREKLLQIMKILKKRGQVEGNKSKGWKSTPQGIEAFKGMGG